MRAVEYFDDKAAFKSKNVSADIETVEPRKKYYSNADEAYSNGRVLNDISVIDTSSADNKSFHYHVTDSYNSSNDNTHIETNGNPTSLSSDILAKINTNQIDMDNNSGTNTIMLPIKNNESIIFNIRGSNLVINNDHMCNPPRRKVTVYLGNLRETVTKQQILNALAEVRPEWRQLTTRLNLRSGWSHAFVGNIKILQIKKKKKYCTFVPFQQYFDSTSEAKELIECWNNKPHKLSATRLRCEVSKRQM
ncbi:hypothetical protein RFI_24949 [Reticulomyxa filosa]|uniref:RRM domain-containing protein n=1 Tax=Reticulomyxa filosa TaxID=46433 RepID=X6MEK5_RETFI|nr:hypothetical protein RFI_24949 [Reticulomyxa filosa]|eukprot:ETO12428.1 hypothetical protein RFI_24949 [Reticulomyxa filosa]